jgi:hypothetical protein
MNEAQKREGRREKILAHSQERLAKITCLYSNDASSIASVSKEEPLAQDVSPSGASSSMSLSHSLEHQKVTSSPKTPITSFASQEAFTPLMEHLSQSARIPAMTSSSTSLIPSASNRWNILKMLLLAIISAVYTTYELQKAGLGHLSWKDITTNSYVCYMAPATTVS